jgi:hypothetical protein
MVERQRSEQAMIQTPTSSPDFEPAELDHLARHEENRLIAAAAAYLAAGDGALPASISTMLGVPSRSNEADFSPAKVRRQLYGMLRRIEEPKIRSIVMRFGLYAIGRAGEPGPDDIFDDMAISSMRPNLGLAFEVLLGGLGLGTSSIGVFDADKRELVKLKPTAGGEYFTLAPVEGGRARKRKTWSVFMSILDGSLALRDPDGRPLVRSDETGSLHGTQPTGAAWRTGTGPAAGLSAKALVDVLQEYGQHIMGRDAHLPAILAVSGDGWIHASSLVDVPGSNDAEKFARCLQRAKELAPVLLCLLDATAGNGGSALIGYAARGESGVRDPGAEHRDLDLSAYLPGRFEAGWDDGLKAGAAISVARARGFAEAARTFVR